MVNDFSMDAIDESEFDTILSEDIEFDGLLVFEKPFLVKGAVSGEIKAKGHLVVFDNAVVKANIQAPRVSIRGTVHGNIEASDCVEVAAKGRVYGDIKAPQIFMETGCVFNGSCIMTGTGDTV